MFYARALYCCNISRSEWVSLLGLSNIAVSAISSLLWTVATRLLESSIIKRLSLNHRQRWKDKDNTIRIICSVYRKTSNASRVSNKSRVSTTSREFICSGRSQALLIEVLRQRWNTEIMLEAESGMDYTIQCNTITFNVAQQTCAQNTETKKYNRGSPNYYVCPAAEWSNECRRRTLFCI